MALCFDFTPAEEAPPLPDARLHNANFIADQASDAIRSRKARERRVQNEIKHPLHEKIHETVRSRKLFIYGMLSLVFFVDVYLEWSVSNEIYTILFPQIPWLLTAFCVTVAVYASLCLGETTSYFSFLSLRSETGINPEAACLQDTVNSQYDRTDRRKKETGWYFHPLMGAITALALLVGIYYASQARVDYLIGADEIAKGFASTYHLYLPVLLYVFEIILGMPTVFFVVCIQHIIHFRQQTRELTKARYAELVLRNAARREYTDYLIALNEYNSWARENKKPERPLIPLSQESRRLLIDEVGCDSIVEPSQYVSDNDSYRNGSNETSASNTHRTAEEGTGAGASQAQSQGTRIDDLLDLMDDRIDQENRDL